MNMRNPNYKAVQIPISTHNLLKEHCDKHGYLIGKFLERLIIKECKPPIADKVLKVSR